jgi:hypothetical protein
MAFDEVKIADSKGTVEEDLTKVSFFSEMNLTLFIKKTVK